MILVKVQSIIWDGKMIPVNGDPGLSMSLREMRGVDVFTAPTCSEAEGKWFVGQGAGHNVSGGEFLGYMRLTPRGVTMNEPFELSSRPAFVFDSFDTEEDAKLAAENLMQEAQSDTSLLDREEELMRGLELKTRKEVELFYGDRYRLEHPERPDSATIVIDELCRRLNIEEG